jgi:hypothetical protein
MRLTEDVEQELTAHRIPQPGLLRGREHLSSCPRPDPSRAHRVKHVLGEAVPHLREPRRGHRDLQITVGPRLASAEQIQRPPCHDAPGRTDASQPLRNLFWPPGIRPPSIQFVRIKDSAAGRHSIGHRTNVLPKLGSSEKSSRPSSGPPTNSA